MELGDILFVAIIIYAAGFIAAFTGGLVFYFKCVKEKLTPLMFIGIVVLSFTSWYAVYLIIKSFKQIKRKS